MTNAEWTITNWSKLTEDEKNAISIATVAVMQAESRLEEVVAETKQSLGSRQDTSYYIVRIK